MLYTIFPNGLFFCSINTLKEGEFSALIILTTSHVLHCSHTLLWLILHLKPTTVQVLLTRGRRRPRTHLPPTTASNPGVWLHKLRYLQFQTPVSDFDDSFVWFFGDTATTAADRFPDGSLGTTTGSRGRVVQGFLRHYLYCCIRRGKRFTLRLTRTYWYPCACCWPGRTGGGGLLWSRMQ